MSVAPPPPKVISPEHVADPYPGLTILRDHYPVFYDEEIGSWLISRYEDVKPFLRAHGPGASMQELIGDYLSDATFFVAMDGTDHRRRRAILAPFFSRGGVEALEGRITDQARGLLEPIFERERKAVASGERLRGEMDFVTEFTAKFSINVMSEMLAFPEQDYGRTHDWFKAWGAAEGNISRDPEIFERALWAKEDFGGYIKPIIEERKGSDGDDLISWLCRAEIEGAPLPDEEIRSIVAVMVLGGGETTDHQLAWVMRELVRHPDVQSSLQADRALLDRVLAESMRHSSILQFSGRIPTEDVEVRGVTIERDTPVALMLGSSNHDPRRFKDPDVFDIYRDDLAVEKAFTGSADHLGFGSGAHFCIGSHISKAEMEIAINVFLDNVHDVRLADGFEPRVNTEVAIVRDLPSLKLSFALN